MTPPLPLGSQRPEAAIANALWMIRVAEPDRAILLVEGDDDEGLFKRHLRRDCHVRAAHGRPRVLGVLEQLRERRVAGVVALVDDDHDRLIGKSIADPDVVVTDVHDLDVHLFLSRAFEAVVDTLGDRSKIETAERDPRAPILAAAAYVGAARLVSRRQTWSIQFSGLDHSRFVSVKNLSVDLGSMVAELRGRQAGASYAQARMSPAAESDIEGERVRGHDLRQLCHGHDITTIMGLALQRLFGSNKPSDVTRERVEQALHWAYDSADFRNSQLWRDLAAWQRRNPGFTLLPG